jgi:crotonobetainyl-CoA:carnitine CoA-transferase CaiB-like acyl-CoA transferase
MLAFDNVRVLDFSRQAPGPFCTMVLADFGADVTVVEPPRGTSDRPARGATRGEQRARLHDPVWRGKRSIVLDLKQPAAREVALTLAREADVVVEGFRPGVADRLGIGWEALHALNPRMIYCSVSGFGQTGPERLTAGHDINYIARAGALGQIARSKDHPPIPPMNVLADYAGGGLTAAFAIATALYARERTGEGQQVDVSMTDGVMYLMAQALGPYFTTGRNLEPGGSFYNGSRPDYNVYRTRDGRFLAVGSLEPHFWRNVCVGLGLHDLVERQDDLAAEAEMTGRFAEAFARKTAKQWLKHFAGKDVCVELVRTIDEAMRGDLAVERGMATETIAEAGETVRTIGVGPKLLGTPGRPAPPASQPGAETRAILAAAGYGDAEIEALIAGGAARLD